MEESLVEENLADESLLEKPTAKNRPKTMKRWPREHLEILIDYLENSKSFEKPTSKAYYHQMTKDISGSIKTTWTILYWKVRNLKKAFMRTEAWKMSPQAIRLRERRGLDDYNEHLLKLCPFYYRLQKIFLDNDPLRMDDSDISSHCTKSQDAMVLEELRSPEPAHEFLPENFGTQIKVQFSPEQSPRSEFVTNFAEEYSHNQNVQSEPTAVNSLVNGENHSDDAEHFKYIIEKLKIEKDIELNMEKLKFEFEIRKKELELRRMEMEQDERLKIMEMNKNERLAKYELELKYRGKVNS